MLVGISRFHLIRPKNNTIGLRTCWATVKVPLNCDVFNCLYVGVFVCHNDETKTCIRITWNLTRYSIYPPGAWKPLAGLWKHIDDEFERSRSKSQIVSLGRCGSAFPQCTLSCQTSLKTLRRDELRLTCLCVRPSCFKCCWHLGCNNSLGYRAVWRQVLPTSASIAQANKVRRCPPVQPCARNLISMQFADRKENSRRTWRDHLTSTVIARRICIAPVRPRTLLHVVVNSISSTGYYILSRLVEAIELRGCHLL